MALWGVEVNTGETYALEPSHFHGRLRITQATLDNYDVLGWSVLEASKSTSRMRVRICALNPVHNPVGRLDLELEEDESVVFSVHGHGSIHLAGYYIPKHPTTATAAGTSLMEKHQQISDKDDTHGKDAEDGNEKNDEISPPPSRNKMGVVEKNPTDGVAATDMGLKEDNQATLLRNG